MSRQRVTIERADVSFWRSLFLNKRNEFWLVIDGDRQRRISGYEAHAIQALADAAELAQRVPVR